MCFCVQHHNYSGIARVFGARLIRGLKTGVTTVILMLPPPRGDSDRQRPLVRPTFCRRDAEPVIDDLIINIVAALRRQSLAFFAAVAQSNANTADGR